MLLTLLAPLALAGPDATRDAFDRLQEVLELRVDDGELDKEAVLPALLVSARPRYEASAESFPTAAIETLASVFGTSGLRVCEACMAPRAWVDDGRVTYQTGPIGIDEIIRLDAGARGEAPAARSAVWIEETRTGLAVRIVDLRTSRVLFAKNIDPTLVENANTERMYTLSEELERRARGDSLTHAFVDVAMYPGQHVSFDWTDQWGKTNANLSGFTISLFDPVLGIGATHGRRVEVLNTVVGGKAILSLPTTLVRAVGGDLGDVQLLDPTLTVTGFARVPFGRSNYGGLLSVSSNGRIGLGISLMNISLLPVLP
ncbi:MAG: hypothetical protein KC656_18045 [Myxococcales bacterium]|nr:hypothetical protein [Myxococcales bacterium]MCB9693868.1 hypothetical protein [Alphaproteobacteria bacterium]